MPRKADRIRITENPALWGMVIQEHGELIEFVSYRVAALRQAEKEQKEKDISTSSGAETIEGR